MKLTHTFPISQFYITTTTDMKDSLKSRFSEVSLRNGGEHVLEKDQQERREYAQFVAPPLFFLDPDSWMALTSFKSGFIN